MRITLSDELRRYLVSEFEIVVRLMETHESPIEKAYYFSAAFGAAQKVANIQCSDAAIHLMVILQSTHQSVATRLQAMLANVDPSVQIPEFIFSQLAAVLSHTARLIDQGEDLDEVLGRFAALGYASTPNGFYLYASERLRV